MPDSGGVHIPPGWLYSAFSTLTTVLFGWLWKDQRQKQEALEGRVSHLESTMASMATKDDLRAMEDRVTRYLGRIEHRQEAQEGRIYDMRHEDGK